MWTVIDPVIRAVITEQQSFSVVGTRAPSLMFWMPTLNLAKRGFRTLPDAGFMLYVLAFTVQLGRRLRPSRLNNVLMLRRGLHAPRLDIYSAVGTRASTLAS